MSGKNSNLMDSFHNSGDSNDMGTNTVIGPVNKITPREGSTGGTFAKPGITDRVKNYFSPTTKYRSTTPGTGTVGGQYDNKIDATKSKLHGEKWWGFFGGQQKTGSVESGGAGGGEINWSKYAGYIGLSGIGASIGDFSGSYYNKDSAKGKKDSIFKKGAHPKYVLFGGGPGLIINPWISKLGKKKRGEK